MHTQFKSLLVPVDVVLNEIMYHYSSINDIFIGQYSNFSDHSERLHATNVKDESPVRIPSVRMRLCTFVDSYGVCFGFGDTKTKKQKGG